MMSDGFKYSFKITGLERKVSASVIAAAQCDGSTYTYAGVPSFVYEAAGWIVDRDGIVSSPETPIGQKDSILQVFHALKTAGASVEGDGTVTLSMNDHNGNSLRNLVNLIWTKQNLLKKSLARQTDIVPESLVRVINSVPLDSVEDYAEAINHAIDIGEISGESELEFDMVNKTISFSFFNSGLDYSEVSAFISLCWRLNEQSKRQKFSSIIQKQVPNEKYAMRVWLIQLGFVGPSYSSERRVLLSRLAGDAAYRSIEAKQAAELKRKGKDVANG